MTDTTASAPALPELMRLADAYANDLVRWRHEITYGTKANVIECAKRSDASRQELAEAVRAALASQPVAHTRQDDRRRFSDPAFNRWLDEGISDSGHTVWDAVGDVQSAWQGWVAREFYAASVQPVAPAVPLTDEQFGASLPDDVARSFTPAELELFERGFRHAESVHKIAAAPDTASASRDGWEGSNVRGNAGPTAAQEPAT